MGIVGNQTSFLTPMPDGAMCDHSQMTECHDGCGHFSCPCGIYWDDGAEGHFSEEDDPNDPSIWES
jgi:hypothetical protein